MTTATPTVNISKSTITFSSATDVAFKGWYSTDGGITATFCPSNLKTLVAGGTNDAFVDCCPTSGCSFPASCASCGVPTTCLSGSIQVYNAKTTDAAGNTGYYTYDCWDGITQTCNSVTIYEQHEKSTDGWSKTAFWCMGNQDPTAIYRNYVMTDTITLTSATAGITTAPTSSFSTSSTTSATPTSTPINKGSSSHAGPIAGGVIGGVVGLSLIVGAVFYFFKKHNTPKPEAEISEFGTEYVSLPAR
ncbi:hypothetical protein N7495_008655 [Penicillium taxi]|uniref:uncharacterized protein n=1 Tax=Penicillium taxi TaxID=168475 RepID=UPI002545049A|nr:uncharacterized protein N7495_008655 [Penicillium taxi]KAJ5888614.1 hypothetical protein N7495_008655 [Penicillium taxi]